MLRIIAGIIVGFIVMVILVMATFGITIAALGIEKTVQPGSYWTTNTFNIIVLIGGFIAAIIGGLVCGMIARNSMAAFALVAILLATGIGSVIADMNRPDPPARTAPATLEDISRYGKEPMWFAFSKIVFGAVGVLIGSSMVKKRRPAARA